MEELNKDRKVTGVRLGYYRENQDELKAAYEERSPYLVGRRARLSGNAKTSVLKIPVMKN